MIKLTKDAVLAEVDATKRELTDIMNVDSPVRDRVRGEMGMDGIQRAVHKVIALRVRIDGLGESEPIVDRETLDAAEEVLAVDYDDERVHQLARAVKDARPMPTHRQVELALRSARDSTGHFVLNGNLIHDGVHTELAYAVLALLNGTES